MKRVTMSTLYAGPGRTVAAGQTAEFDDAEAGALVNGGYGVYADAAPAAAAPDPDGSEDEAKPVTRMTVDELRAYAAEHGIDLGDAVRKAGLLAAIEAAVTARQNADDGD